MTWQSPRKTARQRSHLHQFVGVDAANAGAELVARHRVMALSTMTSRAFPSRPALGVSGTARRRRGHQGAGDGQQRTLARASNKSAWMSERGPGFAKIALQGNGHQVAAWHTIRPAVHRFGQGSIHQRRPARHRPRRPERPAGLAAAFLGEDRGGGYRATRSCTGRSPAWRPRVTMALHAGIAGAGMSNHTGALKIWRYMQHDQVPLPCRARAESRSFCLSPSASSTCKSASQPWPAAIQRRTRASQSRRRQPPWVAAGLASRRPAPPGVAPLPVSPAQCRAGAAAPARCPNAKRAGLGQAAQAAAVAGLAQRGLGGCLGLPVHALPAGGQGAAGASLRHRPLVDGRSAAFTA